MKKALALVIAVILLSVMAPATLAADSTVYVSVSVDGKLEVAAQPVTVTDLTVQGALIAAHAAYYSGGEAGYTGGIDPTYNMFLISQVWGVKATPYVIINGAPSQGAADTTAVKPGDNIIVSVSSDMATPALAISLESSVADGSATVTAKNWVFDFTTFTYSETPYAGAKVIDPETGKEIGTTDAEGKITVPASGVVAIDGLAAIRLDAALPVEDPAASPAPLSDETLPMQPEVKAFLIIGIPLIVVVFIPIAIKDT
jgi:hypothetical protein